MNCFLAALLLYSHPGRTERRAGAASRAGFRFHPFGDGGQIERFGHFNNVRRQRPVLEGIDKRFIDFQRVDVQFLQIAQAGVAGTEIVNRDPMASLTQ